MKAYKNFINGKWVDADKKIDVINPANEEVFATVPVATKQDAQDALTTARDAQRAWGRLTYMERGDVLRKWAALIDENHDQFAKLVSLEVGKPLDQGSGEVNFGNDWFKYYAAFDHHLEGEVQPAVAADEIMLNVPQPIGVAVGIIAWNFPFAMAIRKIAPALIAGNSIVLKPDENTPVSVLELVELGIKAGVPSGVVNIVCGGAEVGEALVDSTIPQLITFTGSTATGKKITKQAAENMTTVSMELGGKAPFIVMDDADIDAAVEAAYSARFLNCGQACICNERTYLQAGIADEFTKKFLARIDNTKVDDPLAEGTEIGPKVNKAELDKIDNYVKQAQEQGAKVAVGGAPLSGGKYDKGYWYAPTVLLDVNQDMDIVKKEIFGPVLPISVFDTEEQAIALANDTEFGLAAYYFSNDVSRIMRAVRDVESGELYVNRGPAEAIHGYHTGWKQSGIHGDDGKHGIESYVRRKTVYLKYKA